MQVRLFTRQGPGIRGWSLLGELKSLPVGWTPLTPYWNTWNVLECHGIPCMLAILLTSLGGSLPSVPKGQPQHLHLISPPSPPTRERGLIRKGGLYYYLTTHKHTFLFYWELLEGRRAVSEWYQLLWVMTGAVYVFLPSLDIWTGC